MPQDQPHGPADPRPAKVVQVSLDRRKGPNLSIWSSICLVAGVVLLIISPQSLLVPISLFLACFILSIFAIANRRFVSGVIMIILLFTVPAICFLARILNNGGKEIEKGVIKLEEEKRDHSK